MNQSGSALGRAFYIVRRLIAHFGILLLYPILAPLGIRPRARHGRRPAEAVRLFLQDVNGALLKLGQILAMRVEFLPEEYIAELQKLLDEVPPFDSALARSIVEQELGMPVGRAFRTFEETPLAAASFGQAHAATLHSGREVVVKVQRPGIAAIVNADLALFRIVAAIADATGLTGRNPLRDLQREFESWTRDELDYRIEASHIQEIYEKSNGSPSERIPKVYWTHTARRVLTMERLRGLWIKDLIAAMRADPEALDDRLMVEFATDLKSISEHMLQNALRQIFVYGIYHADPHAGNLMVMPNGRIGYVDFGIVGRIGSRSKTKQVRVHIALESGDFDEFFGAILSTLEPPYNADLDRFERSVRGSYDDWVNAQWMRGINLRDKSFARLMLRINFAAQKTGVGLRDVEIRIFRALATVDGAILVLSPSLDVRAELRQFFRSYQIRQFATAEVPRLLHNLPLLISRISDNIEHHEVFHETHFSRLRWWSGQALHVLGILLLAGIVGIALIPRIRAAATSVLHMGPVKTSILLLLAALLLYWLGHLLKLHSVVRRPVKDRRRDNRDGQTA
jgi:ubiquinone biosynthesis protein